ncbi:ArnT family glycosyltransferase [Pinibacter aurantiacus]|uniref:Uncharacterized protein n=1 Tax=Pinibacter aurantiacus TaxID=2851599 RepID=A0A9E2S5Z8_9BACT|nr:hypothetical protein [Pinibacter aurantiacus]MBV4355552.1 hypothetical protein [Pinibacter aurantiacus]
MTSKFSTLVHQIAKRDSSRLRLIIFLAACCLWFIHHQFSFLGFYNNDDINYVEYAASLSQNKFSFTSDSQYGLRWACILITGIFYKFFGINDFSTTAYSFISLMVTGWIVVLLSKRRSFKYFILALMLFFLNYTLLFYSYRLLPDPGICLCVMAAYYFYDRYKFDKDYSLWLPVLFGAINFVAVITKESIVLILPLFLWWIVQDLRNVRQRRFWLTAIVTMFVLAFSYLLYFKIATGSWFYRLDVLMQNNYVNICRYDLLPAKETIKRVTYLLWNAFWQSGDGICLIFGITALVYRKKLQLQEREMHILSTFFVLLLCANFMTVSYNGYVPLCYDPRHFLFLLPFSILAGSFLLEKFYQQPFKFIGLPVFFILSALLLVIIKAGDMKYFYGLIGVFLLGWCFVAKMIVDKKAFLVFTICFFCLLSIRPLIDIYRHNNVMYFDHRALIKKTFPARITNAIVYTDDQIDRDLSKYFMQYDTLQVRFLYTKTLSKQLLYNVDGPVYFLLNEKRIPAGDFEKNINSNDLKAVTFTKSGYFSLYRIEKK